MKILLSAFNAVQFSHGRFWSLFVGLLIVSPACGRDPSKVTEKIPQASTRSGKIEEASKTEANQLKVYKLIGVIKGLNAEAKEVRIRHEEIPGFMGAMTMPFTIKDTTVFETLHAGDKVEGKLRVQEEGGMVKDYELTDLKIIEQGSASNETGEELTVSFAGGSPSIRVKPKTLEVGQDVPDFTVTGHDGKAFKLSDLRGEVVALTFIYTRCPLPDFCPMMDRKFSELASRIELSPKRRGHVRLISVSFDPEHDSPDVLKKHATMRGANPPLWTYAVASHEELTKIAPRLGLVYGPTRDEIIHNLCTAVIDPHGRLARLEVGTSRNKWEATDILKTIDSLLGTPSK